MDLTTADLLKNEILCLFCILFSGDYVDHINIFYYLRKSVH